MTTKFNMAAKNHVAPQNSRLKTTNLNLGFKKSQNGRQIQHGCQKSCDTSKFPARHKLFVSILFYCCIFLLLSKNFISYLHPIILHLVIVLLWCHSGVTLVSLQCHCGAGITPVLVLCRCWCHSGVGATPVLVLVSLRCLCYSCVSPVLVSLRCRCWCYSSVIPVLVSLWCWCWCHSGVTPVLVLLRCHSCAGVLPVLPPPGVKIFFKSAINYVQSKLIAQSQLNYQRNNMFNCYVCGEFFTRQFSLRRYMKRKHAQPNVESMKENPKNHQFTENGLML